MMMMNNKVVGEQVNVCESVKCIERDRQRQKEERACKRIEKVYLYWEEKPSYEEVLHISMYVYACMCTYHQQHLEPKLSDTFHLKK